MLTGRVATGIPLFLMAYLQSFCARAICCMLSLAPDLQKDAIK